MPTELIAVLDVDSEAEAMACVDAIGECRWVKIGKQLFTRSGPAVVTRVQERGKRVFLDLKFHDIPNTVNKAVAAAVDLGVGMVNVHATGGRRMLEAARRAVEDSETKLLAVTVLTSLSDEMLRDEVGLQESAAEAVARLARLAVASGAHGLICSPQEIAAVREAAGPSALIVTPGVRPEWAQQDDQSRVMTPKEAAQAGADFIVVGRPIFKATDPAGAVRMIQKELEAIP